jgi:hypothetical protein
MNVKTSFLHGELKEDIYMTQTKHHVEKGKESLVFKLKKYLNGLKQSPRMWYQNFDSFMLGLGFLGSKLDHCVYYKQNGGHLLVITLYVDDMLYFSNSKDVIYDLKSHLSTQFDMKELGVAKYILGMYIKEIE